MGPGLRFDGLSADAPNGRNLVGLLSGRDNRSAIRPKRQGTAKTDPKEPFELRVGIPGKFQIAALDRRTRIDST